MSFPPSPIGSVTPNTHSFSTLARCKDQPRCVLSGDELSFEVAIVNRDTVPIDFPLAYLQKTGPRVKLVDTRTGATYATRPGMPRPALQHTYTTIPPGGSVILEWAIFKGELEHFKHAHIDVNAEITVEATAIIAGRPVDISSSTSLHVTGVSAP